jgi:hypothetical protein
VKSPPSSSRNVCILDDQSRFEIAFRVLVLESEKLENEGILDLLIRGHGIPGLA